jgi:hypothetical protein
MTQRCCATCRQRLSEVLGSPAQRMSPVWLLAVPVSALLTGGSLGAAGVRRRTALWAGVAAGLVTTVALVASLLTGFGECGVENPEPAPPLSWPWSPRRQFCSDDSSPAALGALGPLLLPAAMVMLGTFLRFKKQAALGWIAYAIVLTAPVLPSLYVDALPYYRLDSYPVLHEPLLRPASEGGPARACYVYGIAHGPRKIETTSATSLECVDLEPTAEALSLTPSYDQGRTIYDLDWMGKKLTQKGLPIRPGPTGVEGLVVDRAYKLPDGRARVGATLVN